MSGRYRLWIVEDAAGLDTMHRGCWLQACDVDARGGLGSMQFTTDIREAMVFPSFEEAMEYWRRPSTVRPLRPDGRPNRPLTAYTVEPRLVKEGDST